MRFFPVFAATLLFATTAEAHGGDGSGPGLAHDILHTIGGQDHAVATAVLGLLCLMIAVAPLIAARLARSAGSAKAPKAAQPHLRSR